MFKDKGYGVQHFAYETFGTSFAELPAPPAGTRGL